MVRGKPDFWMLFLIFLLIGFGLIMVFSASYYDGLLKHNDSYYYFKKQLAWSAIGLLIFFVMANTPYSYLQKRVGTIVLISFVGLCLVFVPYLGVTLNGSTRWVNLFGILTFQPSELAKLGALIYMASIMTKKQEYLHRFRKGLLPPLIVLGIFCLLIIKEPHFSTTLIVLVSCLTIVFVAGARIKHLLMLALPGIPFLIWVMIAQDYRLKRWTIAYDPWKDPGDQGFQIIQSLFAIGPGGLSGKGLGNSIQKLAYLPMSQTDFIFSIVAEELGFIGATCLVLLFIAFIIRGVRIALQAPDSFGQLLGIGIITMFAIQTAINLAVVTAMIPVTGVTLPFISYGRTSLLMNLVSAGILLNISRYRLATSAEKKNTKRKRSSPQPTRPHLVNSLHEG